MGLYSLGGHSAKHVWTLLSGGWDSERGGSRGLWSTPSTHHSCYVTVGAQGTLGLPCGPTGVEDHSTPVTPIPLLDQLLGCSMVDGRRERQKRDSQPLGHWT